MKTRKDPFKHVNPTFAKRIIADAEQQGSTAETLSGAIKFRLKNGQKNLLPPIATLTPKLRAARIIASRALDRSKVGDVIRFPSKRYSKLTAVAGYYLSALMNKEATERSYQTAQINNPRKKNLYRGYPTPTGPAHGERWQKIHYKGRYKGFAGSEIYADYQSCIALTVSGNFAVIVREEKVIRRIIAPTGLKWAKDNNGAFLRRVTDGMDYHPTHEDYEAKDFVARVRAAMAKNFKARQESKKTEREQKRLALIVNPGLPTCRVTLYDSRQAGNCIEGSLRYAEIKLGMDREAILAAPWLVTASAALLMRQNDSRAMAAVRAAYARETTVSI